MYGAKGVFCAGNDLENFLELEAWSPERVSDYVFQFVTLTKPFYVLMQGCCIGIIATLMSHADFIYCSEDTFVLTPFQSTNLAPEGLSSIKYVEILGRRKASEMLLTDYKLKAEEAVRLGFANGIITKAALPATEPIIVEVDKLPNMRKLLQADYRTLVNAKKLIVEGQDL